LLLFFFLSGKAPSIGLSSNFLDYSSTVPAPFQKWEALGRRVHSFPRYRMPKNFVLTRPAGILEVAYFVSNLSIHAGA
jgi:hypothetical protein